MSFIEIETALDLAPRELREALEWFASRAGTEIPWPSPSPVPSLDHVVSSPKGIYKPADFEFALSVRITMDSPYADLTPVVRSDGTWVCAYHHEGADPYARDDQYANLGLVKNCEVSVPIALLRQTAKSPEKVRYFVEGIAIVTGWENGFFYLEGFNSEGMARTSLSDAILDTIANYAPDLVIDTAGEEAPDLTFDARKRVTGTLVARQGQGRFRKDLLAAYNDKCAITGCDVKQVIDAAHIRPYRGEHTDIMSNGLLLRTDLHALFDSGLLAIDAETRTVLLSEKLAKTEYASLAGLRISEPNDPADRPDGANLKAHREWCGNRIP
jgi:putative restriction endonuclease